MFSNERALQAYKEGYAAARDDFERQLSIVREELASIREDRDAQTARADAACDLLLNHLGARAISLAGRQEAAVRDERHVRAVRTLSTMPDPTEDLPYGHPMGAFKSKRDASLFNGDAGEASEEA